MEFRKLLDQLPVLGVGASLSFQTEPDPVDLASRTSGPSFIEYAGTGQHRYLQPQLGKLLQSMFAAERVGDPGPAGHVAVLNDTSDVEPGIADDDGGASVGTHRDDGYPDPC